MASSRIVTITITDVGVDIPTVRIYRYDDSVESNLVASGISRDNIVSGYTFSDDDQVNNYRVVAEGPNCNTVLDISVETTEPPAVPTPTPVVPTPTPTVPTPTPVVPTPTPVVPTPTVPTPTVPTQGQCFTVTVDSNNPQLPEGIKVWRSLPGDEGTPSYFVLSENFGTDLGEGITSYNLCSTVAPNMIDSGTGEPRVIEPNEGITISAVRDSVCNSDNDCQIIDPPTAPTPTVPTPSVPTPTPTVPTPTPTVPTPTPTVPTPTPTVPTPTVIRYDYFWIHGCPGSNYENRDAVVRSLESNNWTEGSTISQFGSQFYYQGPSSEAAWNDNSADGDMYTVWGHQFTVSAPTGNTGCTASPTVPTPTPTVPTPSVPTPTVPTPTVPTPAVAPKQTTFYISSGQLSVNDLCNENYSLSLTTVAEDANTVSELQDKILFEADGVTPYFGRNLWYAADISTGTSTQNGDPQQAIQIADDGRVLGVALFGPCEPGTPTPAGGEGDGLSPAPKGGDF